MRRVFLIVIACVAIGSTGCGGNSPEQLGAKYKEALASGDMQTAKAMFDKWRAMSPEDQKRFLSASGNANDPPAVVQSGGLDPREERAILRKERGGAPPPSTPIQLSELRETEFAIHGEPVVMKLPSGVTFHADNLGVEIRQGRVTLFNFHWFSIDKAGIRKILVEGQGQKKLKRFVAEDEDSFLAEFEPGNVFEACRTLRFGSEPYSVETAFGLRVGELETAQKLYEMIESLRFKNKPVPTYLRLANRNQHVEIQNSKGALDLNKPYTIEMLVRVSDSSPKGKQYLAGDEAWPGLVPDAPVPGASGWVLRTKPVEGGQTAFEWVIATTESGDAQWFVLETSPMKEFFGKWHHVAVCRDEKEARVFCDGKLIGSKAIPKVTFRASPTPIYLGVRKHPADDRQFSGDFRGFHICSTALYQTQCEPEIFSGGGANSLLKLEFDNWSVTADRISDFAFNSRNGLLVGGARRKASD